MLIPWYESKPWYQPTPVDTVPIDTASGAVWDGSIMQKGSHEGWNGLLNKEMRQPIYEKQPNKDKQPLNPPSP